MPTVYKVLGQSNPSATTNTTLYTVPAGNSSVISTITVCNLLGIAANFRIAVIPGGAALSNQHYINYDTQIPANDQLALTLGITLTATDVVTVYANTATVSFSMFGTELF